MGNREGNINDSMFFHTLGLLWWVKITFSGYFGDCEQNFISLLSNNNKTTDGK